MQRIGYILTRSLIWILHLLPEKILFCISDFFFLLAFHVVGYRKRVVFDNLSKAFPEIDQARIRKLAKKFYHHLCDLLLESAVSHFASGSRVMSKITYKNPELLGKLFTQGKMVMAVTAHYGNWEYLSTLSLVSEYPVIGIYKPLKNKYFDRMVIRNRSRFGAVITPMDKIARELIGHHREGNPVLTIFLSDQRPVLKNIQYWTKFLGQDTPLYLGTEKLARKLDAAVVFMKVRKTSRGRYQVEFELVTDEPSGLSPFAITDAHVRILEDLIREKPEYWLWSHRRWKHSYEKFLREKESKKLSSGF